MTLVSDIITDAYRQSNLLAIGVAPKDPQNAEGLRYLNRIVKSVFGNEAGDPLTTFPLGRQNIARPSGFPNWGNDPSGEWFVPKNTRLILNLDAETGVYLPPNPNDGCRFAVTDAAGNLSTYPLVVYGNGRKIEGADTLPLSENSLVREWFYREDVGQWVRATPLAIDDSLPFPEEFDDFFITMLAIRLNPAYGVAIDGQSQMALQRARTQMRARYKQEIPMRAQEALVRLPDVFLGRDAGHFYDPSQPNFGDNGGRPW